LLAALLLSRGDAAENTLLEQMLSSKQLLKGEFTKTPNLPDQTITSV